MYEIQSSSILYYSVRGDSGLRAFFLRMKEMVGTIGQKMALSIGDNKYGIHLIDFGNCNFSGNYTTPDDVIK